MIENVKKLKEERQIEELKKLQIEAGLIPASHLQRLDWIYQGPECNKDITTAEEVLIGKSLKDEKPEEKRYFTPVFQESYSNPQNEIFTKTYEDPLFNMKKEELRQRKEIEDNPYKMKMLLKKIEQEVLDKINVKEKKSKKNKKEKKHKKEKEKEKHKHKHEVENRGREKHRDDKKESKKSKSSKKSYSSSRSSSESYDKRSRSKRSSSEYDTKLNLSLNEAKSKKDIKYSKLEEKISDISKSNFGLIKSKIKEIPSKTLGPDVSLYKDRMDLLKKESDLRKKRTEKDVKKLSEEEKDLLRSEMERKARDIDIIKEEKSKEKLSDLKDKEEKLRLKDLHEKSKKNYLIILENPKYIDTKPQFLKKLESEAYNKSDLKLEESLKRTKVHKQK